MTSANTDLAAIFVANAGKYGGEFFIPQHVSRLIAQLALHKQTRVNKIYGPACGSGSLLLQAKKQFIGVIRLDAFRAKVLAEARPV